MTPSAQLRGRITGFAPRRWLKGYGRETLRADLTAGLTVAVMIIPQSMAYAQLAGIPPAYGLYASVVPLIVYALVGTSLHLAVGVIAIDMLLLRAGLEGVADPGTETYIQLAVLLTLVVGIMQLLMGLARMGFLVNLLSRPVMVGFTSGAALLIALSQVGALTGMDLGGAIALPALVRTGLQHWGEVALSPLTMGLSSVAVILLMRRWVPRIPGALVVMVLATVMVGVLGFGDLALIGEVPAGLPALSVPTALGVGTIRSLLPTALALSFLQFLTVISLGKVFAAHFRYSLGHNRELLAIGSANLAGSLFQGLPISGSLSRSAVNVEVGGRTPISNVVTALLVAICLLFFTSALALVPVAVLGAIIVVAATRLIDVRSMRFLIRAKNIDGAIAILTFAATVMIGILEGILVGVVASVLEILFQIGRPNIAVLGHLPGTRSFRDVSRTERARRVEGILVMRVDARFSFMNAERLKDVILDRTAVEPGLVHAVVVDASSINDLDTTAAQVLLEVNEILEEREVELHFAGAKGPVRKVLKRAGILEMLGEDRFHLSPHRAVRLILAEKGTSETYLKHVPGGMED